MSEARGAKQRMSLWRIFSMIFRISATTLGGGAVLIGIIQEDTRRTGLVPEDELADMLALSLAAPGPMGISMSYQAGLALGGLPGAFAAVLGMALPPFIAILVLSGWLLAHMESGGIAAFFSGATSALVIVLAAMVWKQAKKNAFKSYKDMVICAIVAVAILVFNVPSIWGLIGGTILTLIVNLYLEKRAAHGKHNKADKGQEVAK